MNKQTDEKLLWMEELPQFVSKHKTRILFFVGLMGIFLIFLSSFQTEKADSQQLQTTQTDTQSYIDQLEKRLTNIIEKVDGVGKCEVMITAENGVEYVYAVEESQTVNTSNSYEEDGAKRETQQENSDSKYILLDMGGGKKQALVRTEKQPSIQGVVVVCEGAGSMVVQERVAQVVTTALGIPYHKVCVTKINR